MGLEKGAGCKVGFAVAVRLGWVGEIGMTNDGSVYGLPNAYMHKLKSHKLLTVWFVKS